MWVFVCLLAFGLGFEGFFVSGGAVYIKKGCMMA